jgi:hypothetical protein
MYFICYRSETFVIKKNSIEYAREDRRRGNLNRVNRCKGLITDMTNVNNTYVMSTKDSTTRNIVNEKYAIPATRLKL